MEMTFLHNAMMGTGFAFITKVKSDLVAAGKDVTGELVQSNAFRVEPSAFGLSLKIVVQGNAVNYFEVVDKGRRKGTFPPVDNIKKWIRDRGIQPDGNTTVEQLAFLIGRKIKRDGIPATNIYTDNIENFSTAQITAAAGQDVSLAIRTMVQGFR
jgi:hypothetical protein